MAFTLFGKSRETQSLQLYGKLPIAKDYLRIGCGDGAARDWREWLDRTFGTVREGEAPLVLREALRFVIGGKEPVQGALWASTDAGGHRAFPFTLLVVRRSKALIADLQAGLGEAEGVWRSLAEIFAECQTYADGRDLLERQRGRDVQVAPKGAVSASGADYDTWVEALWSEEGVGGLNSVFEGVATLARDGYLGPYRLPLVRELPIRDQVLAWTSVLQELAALGPEPLPTLFFPPRTLVSSFEMASLVVSGRPLSEDQVPWLTTGYGTPVLGPGDFCSEYEGDGPELRSAPEEAPPLRLALVTALSSFRGGKP